jgi:hypothetical protein
VRPVSADKPSRLALIIAALLATFGIIGVVGSWGAYSLDSSIEREGVRATGRVLDKHVLAAADDSDFIVEYSFELPSGERLTNSPGVSKALWSRFHKGDAIEIYYSAENPRRNFPVGAGVTSLGVTIFVSLISAVVGLFGYAILHSYFRGPAKEPRDA